jgi:uncharacterized protein YacL
MLPRRKNKLSHEMKPHRYPKRWLSILGDCIFFLLCITFGYVIGSKFNQVVLGVALGGVAAVGLLLFEYKMMYTSIKTQIIGICGLVSGLIVGSLLSFALFKAEPLLTFCLNILLGYLGAEIALKKKTEIMNLLSKKTQGKEKKIRPTPKILDTSVLIDGRIMDIAETQFVEGPFIIPRFVLKELQKIADSPDGIKRNRGRRGLEILNKMQKNKDFPIQINEMDFNDIKEVDAKLIKLAKISQGKILTNDYNLNKIAEIEGVKVLNINELAEALRPVVLPGEELNIQIIKEGKEFGQGVGYLEDGTMVVVDNGIDFIGKKVKVSVTSVLQTSAGRIIFTKIEKTT